MDTTQTSDFSFLLKDLPEMEPRSARGYVPPIEQAGEIPEPSRRRQSNREKVAVSANTAAVEALLDGTLEVTEEDKDQALQIFKSGRDVTKHELEKRPGMLLQLDALMTRYDFDAVADANAIRRYVVHRLLEESDGKNDMARLRALEKLGNLSEVGAFTERKEITVRNETTESLNDTLRGKLEKLRGKIVEGEVVAE